MIFDGMFEMMALEEFFSKKNIYDNYLSSFGYSDVRTKKALGELLKFFDENLEEFLYTNPSQIMYFKSVLELIIKEYEDILEDNLINEELELEIGLEIGILYLKLNRLNKLLVNEGLYTTGRENGEEFLIEILPRKTR